MIKIESVEIYEFRGIKKLSVDLKSKSFGVSGPNGSGKSGLVDAIEFCLTGDVTRLSGSGTYGISVKSHAPHVDHRNNPENSKVKLSVRLVDSGDIFEISRCVKNPYQVEISPEKPEFRGVVETLGAHPEFALSRREIVKYIITPPGKRSEDVQTLLRLDYLEDFRKSLTTTKNYFERELNAATRAKDSAASEFKTLLGLEVLNANNILDKINELREILNLEALTELKAETSFVKGVNEPSEEQGEASKNVNLSKDSANKLLGKFLDEINGELKEKLNVHINNLKEEINTLSQDDHALELARKHTFFSSGIDFLNTNKNFHEHDICPLCDSEFEGGELVQILENKLLTAHEIKNLLSDIDKNINLILGVLDHHIDTCKRVLSLSANLDLTAQTQNLSAYKTKLESDREKIESFRKTKKGGLDASRSLDACTVIPEEIKADIELIHQTIKSLPESSALDEARDKLVLAQERFRLYQKAKRESLLQSKRFECAKTMLDSYNEVHTKTLNEIYDSVAKEFSKYYSTINSEDEAAFKGKLIPAPSKLGFDVDFYGRGLFPPGAYHSEGHQDSMGLCLYLALMKHTLGEDFTFSVLDDVLMSVDRGHRRQVCRLLKSEFPHTQFILTTHDSIWLRFMRVENLITKSQSFGGWSVDTGPLIWEDADVWNEIAKLLASHKVTEAAAKLRNYLEFTATILADNLGAQVQFKGDGSYDLGSLMPPAISRWKKHLQTAKDSAKSWGNEALGHEIDALLQKVSGLQAKGQLENWAVNTAVHYNEWENLSPEEFKAVVKIYQDLIDTLRCSTCGTYLYILPKKGTNPEEIRCSCSTVSYNLVKKPKE